MKQIEDVYRLMISECNAENARLRAELEALRPKPVVTVETNSIKWDSREGTWQFDHHNKDNLKLTFHDGVLHSAEVLK